MGNNHSFKEMGRTSYKPSANELRLRDEFVELKHNLFKGVTPKLIRMSGQLYDDLDELLTNAKDIKENEEAILLQRIMRSMDEANKRFVRNSKKKHIFITGRRVGNFQILITEHVLPVPHVSGLSITLVTAELNVLGTGEYGFKSSRWGLMVDDEMSKEVQEHYIRTISLQGLQQFSSYLEIMKHIIFQVTPYQMK